MVAPLAPVLPLLGAGALAIHRILVTMNGEKVVLHGSGISVAGKGTGIHMRGVRYAQTNSPSLSRLNNAALVFELEMMPDGTVHDKWWEWK